MMRKMNLLSKAMLLASVILTGCSPAQFNSTPSDSFVAKAPPGVDKTSESFVQGDGGNQLDVLIVNDNSMSMGDEQAKLAARFGSFIGAISDIDYHIGMTTTDLESPRFNQGGRLLSWTGTAS